MCCILKYMTEWANLLIPAASAAFGGLVGGGSAILTQVVTRRGTSSREQEARHDVFKVKRFEIERETLLASSARRGKRHAPHIRPGTRRHPVDGGSGRLPIELRRRASQDSSVVEPDGGQGLGRCRLFLPLHRHQDLRRSTETSRARVRRIDRCSGQGIVYDR